MIDASLSSKTKSHVWLFISLSNIIRMPFYPTDDFFVYYLVAILLFAIDGTSENNSLHGGTTLISTEINFLDAHSLVSAL